MVQRSKLNSTCKVIPAVWDLGGARREMTDLKARNKGKKPNENMVSLQTVQAQGEKDGQEYRETAAERQVLEKRWMTLWEAEILMNIQKESG